MKRKKERVEQKLEQPFPHLDSANNGQREFTIYPSEWNQCVVASPNIKSNLHTKTKIAPCECGGRATLCKSIRGEFVYGVECSVCGRDTLYVGTVSEAIHDWNCTMLDKSRREENAVE